MKSSSIIGIALLVIAASLAMYAPFLQRSAEVTPALSEPTPVAMRMPDRALPDQGASWDSMEPKHVPVPKRHRQPHHKAVKHAKATPVPKRKVAARNTAPAKPLAGPTFLPGGSDPTPAPELQMIVPVKPAPRVAPRVEVYRPPVVKPKPRPKPTIYAPPTPSPRDLARQRALERRALLDAAVRAARGTVERTVPGVQVLSAEGEDHNTYMTVIVVEHRSSGTVIESFMYTPGPSALGLAQRKVISQNNADPYVSH